MTLLVVRRHSRYAEDIIAKLISLEEYGIGAYLGESINSLARRTRELIEALPSSSLTELEEPSSPESVEDETTEAGLVAGEAYQVIGALSHYANMFDDPEVQRALDWFSGFEPGVTYKDDASILPWPKEELKPDDYSALAARIEALEEENEELHDSLEAAFLGTPGWRAKARQALAKKEG